MTLQQFLSALITPNVTVTLTDLNTGTEIASLKAATFSCLDDAIEAREVKQWTISSATAIRVVLASVETTTTEP